MSKRKSEQSRSKCKKSSSSDRASLVLKNKKNTACDDLTLESDDEEVGRGVYGIAVKKMYKGELRIVKFVEEHYDDYEPKIQQLLAKDNIYIAKILDHCKKDKKNKKGGIIVMEYLTGGNIEYHARNYAENYLTTLDYMIIVRDLLQGLDKIHAMGAAHRDIKPDNIMFTKNPEETSDWRAVFIDFGFVCIETENKTQECNTLDVVAAEHYRPPEKAVKGLAKIDLKTNSTLQRGQAHDVWALGATFLYFLYGDWIELEYTATKVGKKYELAWETQHPVDEYEFDNELEDVLDEVIRPMLALESSKRISAQEACERIDKIFKKWNSMNK